MTSITSGDTMTGDQRSEIAEGLKCLVQTKSRRATAS
jgi:hypothetical protein